MVIGLFFVRVVNCQSVENSEPSLLWQVRITGWFARIDRIFNAADKPISSRSPRPSLVSSSWGDAVRIFLGTTD